MAEIAEKKSLWMRSVDFNKLKDLLHIVNTNNGLLKAVELERIAVKEMVLTKGNSEEPLAHTPRFHYRKILENLSLARIKDGNYWIANNEQTLSLLKNTCYKKEITEDVYPIFRQILLLNVDCRKYFFDVFIDNINYDMNDFCKNSSYIIIHSMSMQGDNIKKSNKKYMSKKLSNPNGKQLLLNTPDKIQAIFWGLRVWALIFKITDEVILNPSEGRIIYPINYSCSRKILFDTLKETIRSNKKEFSSWVNIHIPSFIHQMILLPYGRASVDFIKEFLYEIVTSYSEYMFFIPTSTSLIDSKIPFDRQDHAYRQCYLYIPNKGYMSHIKINTSFLEENYEH